ncbi:TnsD family Tn7-like transposition protein [Vibrio astriarenae]|uniref:TnsD family Tn7-like transposition protein n=1 Tax=Vibrio astriarenae TaxID=1481923 RepID=UPI003736B570
MKLPHAYPDELLFGRVIRYLTLSGETPGSFVGKILLSSRHKMHPALTAGVKNLAKLADEGASELLYRQTLAPIFMFYLPSHSNKLKTMLMGNDGNKALWQSQLASFGLGHSCGLKWCSQCAKEDVVKLGVSYWRRSHQILGVSVCHKHQQRLHHLALNSRQGLSKGLYPTCESPKHTALGIELTLAKFSNEILQLASARQAPFNCAQAYRNKLDDLGYITRGFRVRRLRLFDEFYQYCSSYPQYDDNSLPRSHRDYRYLSELLIPMSNHHPFRHLLFGSWLFESAEELSEFETVNTSISVKSSDHVSDCGGVEKCCVNLLSSGKSMAEVCRRTGKSRTYLKRIAAKHGIRLNLKPRKLTTQLKKNVLRLAKLSMHRERIASICDISIGSVEQIISSQSGLVSWRKQCHFESKRRRCRVNLKRYVVGNPNALRRDIKSGCNASFFWLYHNDRKWLEKTLPIATKHLGFGKYQV